MWGPWCGRTCGDRCVPDERSAIRNLDFFAVSGRVGGDASELLLAYQVPLESMHELLFNCIGADCAIETRKSLLGVQPSLGPGSGDHVAEFKGPQSMAATFAENLQLEYLEGMPDEQVGWGRVNEDKIRALMALHAASSDLLQRTPLLLACRHTICCFTWRVRFNSRRRKRGCRSIGLRAAEGCAPGWA
jgi:hypothetical protein